ncbi:S8 family peptidase [Empedobacter brevis]|uniref:S8 family peptidase n=1 Tax=Empedobacter brevis TaxID=247 RepID=UPI0039AF58E9
MKKNLLSFSVLILLTNFANAQSNDELKEKFSIENKKNVEFFNRLQSKQSKNNSIQNHQKDVNTIAVASEEFIFFNKLTDNRANIASNVESLQNAQIGGFSINGEDMELTIFDGGKVYDAHQEFVDKSKAGSNRIIDLENGAQGISSHSTAVSGFIAAEGIATIGVTSQDGQEKIYENAAKGVLPKATVSSAGFATVKGKNIYTKILEFSKNISNHSYGSNVGWSLIEDKTHPIGYGLQYNTDSSKFESADESMFGAYYANDYNYDIIVNANPKFTIVKSAGNSYGDGPSAYKSYNFNKYKSDDTLYTDDDILPNDNCSSGANCISLGSLAKNIIVVGSVDVSEASDYKFTDNKQIVHSSYSSAGPRKDGAIKPDIVAVGTDVIAPSYNEATISTKPNPYTIGSGTSYSAPKVTGVVGALTQLKRLMSGDKNFYFYADEIKVLLLHTTQEAGDFEGPDNKFGWGLMDAKKAAETLVSIQNEEALFERNDKKTGENYERTFKAKAGEDLKVTISWIDPAIENFKNTIKELSNDKTSKLVNDLDLRVIDMKTNEVFFPWKLDLSNPTGAAVKGDNLVDNIEQIIIKSPATDREYKVVITNKGNLIDSSKKEALQPYTLLVTGVTKGFLGTDELTVDKAISVYPTLAKDVVNIKTTEKIISATVFDMSGKQVASTDKKQINVSNLPVGVYVINIKTDKQTISKKIVKQ